jgi:hypothetical protein
MPPEMTTQMVHGQLLAAYNPQLAKDVTPEGQVKSRIDAVLAEFEAYRHKPVQNGMGKPALDYHVCHRGMYAAIEAKAPGGKMTRRQCETASDVLNAGGSVFLVDAAEGPGMWELYAWLANPQGGALGMYTAQHMAEVLGKDLEITKRE